MPSLFGWDTMNVKIEKMFVNIKYYILQTDMDNHDKNVESYKKLAKGKVITTGNLKEIMAGILKASDIGNPATAPELFATVLTKWTRAIMLEWYEQGDVERKRSKSGEETIFTQPELNAKTEEEKAALQWMQNYHWMRNSEAIFQFDEEGNLSPKSKAGSSIVYGQVGFIEGKVKPLYEALQALIPGMNVFVQYLNANTATWRKMADKNNSMMKVFLKDLQDGYALKPGGSLMEGSSP